MSLTVRKPKFDFPITAPSYWYDDNKFVSCFLSALSITFPAGEKFFIEAVRDCSEGFHPEIQKEIKLFIAQEAQHSLRHREFNEWLQQKGYKAEEFENFVIELLKIADMMPRKYRLAATCALEHITSILADRLLYDNIDYSAPIAEEFREMWKWHALEEDEHKSISMDVYRLNGYDEPTRLVTMVVATVILAAAITGGQTYLAVTKKGSRTPADFLKGLNLLYGPKGFITRSIPKYLTYFKIGFHPESR